MHATAECGRPVRRAIARAVLCLALAGPAAASDPPRLVRSIGFAWLERGSADGPAQSPGIVLEIRAERRMATPHLGWGMNVGWGITDWDRAREWIDAGNRVGRWTTDRFADVEGWVRNGKDDGTAPARFMGAIFADFFLAFTYLAVPVCYVGSAGGATSHFEFDFTGSVHVFDGPDDVWAEAGGGAVGLAERPRGQDTIFQNWQGALGPVVGMGAQVGPVHLGAHVLFSPPALNSSSYGGRVVVGSVTVGVVR